MSAAPDPAASPWGRPLLPPAALLLAAGVALPWSGLRVHLLIMFLLYGVVAQCWNLVIGVSGILSFGQLALFVAGGFATGALSVEAGWSPWASLWAAPVTAVMAALLIGLPALRLRGTYVVLLTLAFHELLRAFVANGPNWISHGGHGFREVPKLGFERWLGPRGEIYGYYYAALVLFAATSWAVWRLLHSPVGAAFRALRDSETYAVSRGIDPFRYKLFLFAFSAFFTGLAGGLMTHYNGSVSPTQLGFGLMIQLLAMIVLGGWGTFWGPIVGAALLTFLWDWLYGLEEYRTLALGGVLAAVAVLAPRGLVPLAADLLRRALRRPGAATVP